MARRVSFDRSLYAPEAVTAAAEAYAAHAGITVRELKKATVATFQGSADNIDQTVHAFANHVLFETIVRRRQAVRDKEA